ncbi:acyltransferase [Lactococcus lactis]|uniref:acyltransferase n=1 Tax=Lactococcus lactis TaxID=1358 RepID=UPI001F0E6E5A|nr:acyltransferase [Lactococcus lactis]MCH5427901.1 acyltransferase [Lactococcus lactis]MCT0086435.1 acyltransferase [Lactococcus lactis subsp. lactis]
MKELLNTKIAKIWGENIKISSEIPLSYTLLLIFGTLLNLIRGGIKSVGFGKKEGAVFIGRHVTLRMKQKIYTGSKVRFEDGCQIMALSSEGFHFGNNVKIGPNSKMMSGSIHKLGKGVSIGNNCFFSDYTFFGAAGGIKIGDNIISGQNVRFHSENHNFLDNNKLIREQGVSNIGIELGDDIWIGAGAVFLDGSKIGNHCVVAANAVVQKEFPDNCVIGGVPAKLLKML